LNRSSNAHVKRRVWRVTSHAPLGEFVDPDDIARGQKPPGEVAGARTEPGGWLVSSFELAHGLDVSEEPDTSSAALLGEFFKE
jgi:hypothetical protein